MKETFFQKVLRYAKMPSTWRGLAALAGAFGLYIHPELLNQIIVAVGGIIGAIEFFRDEHKTKASFDPTMYPEIKPKVEDIM